MLKVPYFALEQIAADRGFFTKYNLNVDFVTQVVQGIAGIPAIVRSPRSDVAGKLDAPVDLFSLLVPTRDLARARSLLEEQRAALESDPDSAARAAEEAEEAEENAGR